MLPGKSCTRFWVPGGSQGPRRVSLASQEAIPLLYAPLGYRGRALWWQVPIWAQIRDYAVITTHDSVHAAREILHSMLW